MINLQSNLYLQMLQERESKNDDEEEEEENEHQDQPGDAQEQGQSQKRLLGHYQHAQDLMSSSKSASKKPTTVHNARYGKIVNVHGGHSVRSIARKDRHSKAYTLKGPRDRRFRLSATTAIQFYDVQDRLGYDRPSKAVDWLIQKAKASIEALSEQPCKEYDCTNTSKSAQQTEKDIGEHSMHQLQHHQGSNGEPETMNTVNPTNNGSCFEEPVLDPHQLNPVNYAEEALNSASTLSDSELMEMSWFHSLMTWNYNAGDGGEDCPFSSSNAALQ